MKGYCVKEKKVVEISKPKLVRLKNGRTAAQGVCPDCGTKMFKLMSKEAFESFTVDNSTPCASCGTRIEDDYLCSRCRQT